MYKCQQRTLTSLRAVLEPWMTRRSGANHRDDGRHRCFRLVKRAREFMAELGPDRKLSMPQVARHLDVSERTLYNAFRQWLGIGPYEYYLVQRLHAFREELRRGDAYPGKVTRAALDTGFHHFGQLGLLYRRHVGETPTETMRHVQRRRMLSC